MPESKYDCSIVEIIPVKRFADLILDMGTFLLASGAHSGRVETNIRRIALTWGFDISLQPTFKGLLVTARSHCREDDTITMFKESPTHAVHLEVLTRVSHLSWKVYEKNLSIEETEHEFDKIKAMRHYNPWLVSIAVGLSCTGLCFLSGGDLLNGLVAFWGAFFGSLFRYKIAAMRYNQMISISIAAFITTTITGLGTICDIGDNPQSAMATAVLYLIPGVPLINSVIDLIEGYLSSAVNRALFAGFILLCIAAGMTLSITLMGIDNFDL